MSPYCNKKHLMEALGEVPERPGWLWAIGSVGFHGERGRYVFRPLVGPGLDIIKGGEYRRVILNLGGVVVDTSIAKLETRKIYLVLPREYNHVWARLYGTCQIGYVIPKRLFLLLTDQIITDYLITYVYRRPISPKLQSQ
jgi:hypothetical protein